MLLIIGSLASLSINWIHWGLDFTGGTLIEVGFEQPAVLPDVRDTLAQANFNGAIVQHFGSSHDVMIRIAPQEGVKGCGNRYAKYLMLYRPPILVMLEMRRIEFVGPNVGEELAEDGGLAIIISLICIMIYVSARFEWRLADGCGNGFGT